MTAQRIQAKPIDSGALPALIRARILPPWWKPMANPPSLLNSWAILVIVLATAMTSRDLGDNAQGVFCQAAVERSICIEALIGLRHFSQASTTSDDVPGILSAGCRLGGVFTNFHAPDRNPFGLTSAEGGRLPTTLVAHARIGGLVDMFIGNCLKTGLPGDPLR